MDTLFYNGRVTTLDPSKPEVEALGVKDGRIVAAGTTEELEGLAEAPTRRIDLAGRRVIPGLNDSHLHVIRAGLYYNLELRWDGKARLGSALEQLKEQVARTPPPQWVRVIGGWNEFQFAEGRMPTLEEVNAIAPDTPVFILHLYDCALLNGAALRACGFTKETPNPPGGLMTRDRQGNPTGLLVAEPNALILYSTIAHAPKLDFEDQLNSTRHFMREMNRFGVTSVSDAGGGGQNYPKDYGVVQELDRRGQLTLRVAYSLFAQKPGEELADYTRWLGMTAPGQGSEFLRVNGAGENLVWSAADFENFLQPRPELRPTMESELEAVIRKLAENDWPWRIHATYDETIRRFLSIFERVHRDTPIDKLGWFIDHAETVAPETLERIKALGGGVAVQHRMAYQGEYFVRRYGVEEARKRPPIRKMLELGIPVGAGTDGTRVASYHPWTCLWWLVTGKTVGGLTLNPDESDRLSREEALRLYTKGSAWFSREGEVKGVLAPGKLADFAVLNNDYFEVEPDEIRQLESVMTVVGGKVVYGTESYQELAPEIPPVSPSWSPVAHYGGYQDVRSPVVKHDHPMVMGADGRLWEQGCGCWF